MSRNLPNWLDAYIRYTTGTEAPKLMHFFAGVSAIAGCLRRKVWIDQLRFSWYPSFYICFVADPGVVSKSSTADIAMDLLRSVPGINFGPDSVTWQSLVVSFSTAGESYVYLGDHHPMSALTLVASEFGSLMDLSNQEMVNLFIELWDGKHKYEKQTKMSGCETIEAPWINLLACTTPSWVATNMSYLATAGGLTSRTLYVFGEAKANLIAQPRKHAPVGHEELRRQLVQDLEHIATNLCGPFSFSPEAEEWEVEWYRELWTNVYKAELPDWQKGYLARKQTHLNKLAMILSVSRGDSLRIELEDYQLAELMLRSVESDLARVFSLVGRSEESRQAERLIDFIRRHGEAPYETCYRVLHGAFPDARDFEGIVSGALKAGYIRLTMKEEGPYLQIVDDVGG
jgi:hypothetical protein